jgi:glycosyltransferase involved in cell wall biosynthesis
MLVSAIVCAHSLGRRRDLEEAVASLLEQTHRELEIIVVVDGDEELYRAVAAGYSGSESVRAVLLEKNVGISGARNAGVAEARGEVIAFIDDDAVADRSWIETLVGTYERFDAVAVGGRVLPVWLHGEPEHLPPELYWLVGATHEGFAVEGVSEVRNTFGPNMSFRREVFEKVGGFNQNLGFSRRGTSYVQAEEPEFALRMRKALGRAMVYNPDAVVYHKITESKTRVRTLLRRSYYQGYSKAWLKRHDVSGDPIATERAYLRTLLLKAVPARLLRSYRPSELKKLLLLLASLVSVGLGYAYGYCTERVAGWRKR